MVHVGLTQVLGSAGLRVHVDKERRRCPQVRSGEGTVETCDGEQDPHAVGIPPNARGTVGTTD